MQKLLFALCALLLLTLSCYLFLYNLGAHSISAASDEVVYVRVIQGILHQGEIYPLWHGGLPFHEKPPLKFWLSSVLPLLLGESNLSFRLLDGILGLVCIALSVILSRCLFNSWLGALITGLLLLGAPEWVISHHSFRRVVLDGLLTTLILIASIYAWRAYRTLERNEPATRSLAAFSFFCGLAALTKSVAGLVPIASMLVLFTLSQHGRKNWKSSLLPLSVGPLIFMVYLCLVAFQGKHALHTFLGMEIFHRVVHGFTGHNTGEPWYYFKYIFVRGGVIPVPLLLLGLAGSLYACVKNNAFRFSIVWCFLPLIIYSFSSSKAPWYLNPFMPFFAMTAVFGTLFIIRQIPTSKMAYRFVLVVAVCALFLPTYYRTLTHHVAKVAQQNQRLPIDEISQEIIKEKIAVSFLTKAISGRSSPINGHFNVEGIYRQMIRENIRIIKNVSEIEPSERQYVFLEERQLAQLPENWKKYKVLPPFEPRKNSLVVVSYNLDSVEDSKK